MFFDEDLEKLPQNSQAAFVKLIDLLNRRLAEDDGDSWHSRAQQYVQVVLGFVDAKGLNIDLDRLYPNSEYNFSGWFERFRNSIIYYQARYRFSGISSGPASDVASVELTDSHRAEIHTLLNKIRKIIPHLHVSERKQTAIYNKIAALHAEVDKPRTGLDRLMAVILEVSDTAGEAADNLEPVVKLVERLRGAFVRAKSDSELPALPAPDGEPVMKRLTGPATPLQDRDDEIPF
jgi:hypothetical protein